MGTKETFIDLIHRHEKLINKVVFMYTDDVETRQDLYQDIVASAWSSFPRFQSRSKFSTWLYRIALNVSITALKKRKKVTTTLIDEAPEQVVSADSEKELLQLILLQLNPIEKSLVLLLVEGLEQSEIGEILGISDGNVRVKIHRIREKLKKYGIETFVG